MGFSGASYLSCRLDASDQLEGSCSRTLPGSLFLGSKADEARLVGLEERSFDEIHAVGDGGEDRV